MKRHYLCLALFLLTTCLNAIFAINEKAYLFVYFTGNNGNEESIRYAISYDGYNYRALNDNQPVIDSRTISSTGGVRDPHILRGEDGKTFYMVVTDMVSAKGWDSNRAMVLLKSTDLLNWQSAVVNIQTQYPRQENLKRVWAPQTIYDKEAGKYMIYWSMQHGDGPDIIYYVYANKEFTGLEGEPKQLFFPADGKPCIDGDIIYQDGQYHLFYKTEGHGNGLKKAVSNSLTSGKWQERSNYLQQTQEAVEGSSVFKLIDSDKYILMYDMYMSGKYQFTESRDLENFKVIDQSVSMNFKPRHGTVMPISEKELKRLLTKWPLTGNPVLTGFYADPEILYSQKTKRFYIYPTSDGFTSWEGYYFKTFSSRDLKTWKDEGVILDLPTQVSWADKRAWAPCIIEKKTADGYKYYYYFSAEQKIGVAVSDSPTGPFKDSGRPLVDKTPAGVHWGQQIDPDVFHDPVSGKYYLYWGNLYMAVAELNDDMVSLKPGTTQVIATDKTYCEGTYVFFRNGIYYFLWSENDTRSPDYRVRYGTSKSPVGPINIPPNNLILTKNESKGIYGTGHNSVLQLPRKDKWYIVYHRFTRPEGVKMGEQGGYHREVCIDEMQFTPDGAILPIIPTLDGVK